MIKKIPSTKTGKLAKPTKKAKKTSIPKNIRDRTLSAMQKLRKLEECNNGYCVCISCGKVMPFSETQGGHYISRMVKATEIEKDNIWPQCERCNGYLRSNHDEYRYRLVQKIGEARVKRLENMAHASKVMTNREEDEAYMSLSDEDKALVNLKRTPKVYQAVYTRIMQRIKELELE